MDILEKALLEWSLRTDKGYPDISNEEDLHIFESTFGFKLNEQDFALGTDSKSDEVDYYKEILSLLDARKNNKKLLVRVYKTLSESSNIDEVKKYLKESGITKETFDQRNLPNEIIDILLKGKPSVEQFYNEVVIKSNSLTPSGNVYTELIKDQILREKIESIGKLTGSKNSVRIGAGEILFPLLFSGLRQKSADEKGDLEYQGKNMEVKSTSRSRKKYSLGARLGSSRSSVHYKPFNERIQGYGGKSEVRFMEHIIYDDYEASKQNNTLKAFRQHLVEFLSDAYKRKGLTIGNFNSPEDVYELIVDSCILGYKQEKGIDIFLLFDPRNGSFKTFLPDGLVKAIIKKEITITNFSQSNTIPQLKDIV